MRTWLAAAAAAILLMSAEAVEAVQIKPVTDGAEVAVRLSSVDVNRISASGDRIATMKAEDGRFTQVKNDPNTGDLFIQSADGNKEDAVFFVTTERGYTYRLLANFAAIPGEQIMLMNVDIGGSKAADEWERKTPFKESVINLLSGMATGKVIKGYESDFGERVIEKSPLLVMSVGRYTGRNLEGEVFFVRNDSPGRLRLEESRFKAPRVAAVYIEQPDLNAGETTRVMLVSRRGMSETAYAR